MIDPMCKGCEYNKKSECGVDYCPSPTCIKKIMAEVIEHDNGKTTEIQNTRSNARGNR